MQIASSDRIILASASPRRIELLKLMGLPFDSIPAGIEETVLPNENPRRHVLRLSKEKTSCIARIHPTSWVIGADTIVFIDGEIIGKPATPEEARVILAKLSNRKHEVFTGFCIMNMERGVTICQVVRSSVIFRKIDANEISWYTNTPEPYDKAGAYAVQGISAAFIREIKGSFTNVMGLPMCELVEKLKISGAIYFSGEI
jgi:septum formation protein